MTTHRELSGHLGRYRILRKLGAGGMGTVYLASDSRLGRQVALKVPHPNSESGTHRKRFEREARLAGRLVHPHLCPVLDVEDIDGVLFFTMPYIEGVPLSSLISKAHPWPPPSAAEVLFKVGAAISYLHAHGIIHRDLKPGNILIQPSGEPVVMDFGLAREFANFDNRVTESGVVLGSPAYMAPEQVAGASDLGPAVDVYALGVLLFELITGRLPFEETSPKLYYMILQVAPPSPSSRNPTLGSELDALCREALSKDPNRRPANVDSFLGQLSAALGLGPITHFIPPSQPDLEEVIPDTQAPEATRKPLVQGFICPDCGEISDCNDGSCGKCGGTLRSLRETATCSEGTPLSLQQSPPLAVSPAQDDGPPDPSRHEMPLKRVRRRHRQFALGGLGALVMSIPLLFWVLRSQDTDGETLPVVARMESVLPPHERNEPRQDIHSQAEPKVDERPTKLKDGSGRVQPTVVVPPPQFKEPNGEVLALFNIPASPLLFLKLRDVINQGADLYNGGDWNGCYRLYEGALLMSQPLLKKHPELRQVIEDGIKGAGANQALDRRAFDLRKVLDRIRALHKVENPVVDELIDGREINIVWSAVINQGADLYNGGDWNGCYRLYEGALEICGLLFVKQPEMRREIANGLTRAKVNSALDRRAHDLRAVIDWVRSWLPLKQ